MNIALTGKKISQDERILAFKKDNLTAQMTFTVDTDDSWTYKLDVRLPVKCCTGEELFNIIDLPMDANRTCTIDVTAAMVPFTGKYTMQLRGISGELVYHSDTFEIWVKYSIDPGAVYDPVPSEFYQIEQNVTEMNNHPPKPGENGYWLIWDITTQQYKESAIPLPDGTLPDITAATSGKYLSNDGKKAYWTEVQAGEGNKINKIEVNGVEQSIVDKTVNISVPTKTSDLSNDSGYITNEALTGYATKAELPTKVSQLENDSKFINESAIDGYAKIADIPTKTSQLNNDSGYITANDVPVKSVDGATGDIVTNAVKTTQQTLTDTQKQQARTNIGAGVSSFDGDYNSLTNKPTIPTKISELDNDSGFITEANIPVKSVNGKTGNVTLDAKAVGALPDTTTIPSKTSELDNDSGFITNDALSGKQDEITGAATTITNSNLTANCTLISDANGKVAVSDVTSTELGYLDGVTSNVQTQLNGKQGVDDEIQGLRLRGGINSIGSSNKSVAINPAVNGIGFARLSGGTVKVYYDGYEMPITDSSLDNLFDGKLGTYVNFGIPVGDFTWKNSVTYTVGAYVQDKGTGYWYKALKENTNVSPVDDTTETWAFASASQTGNYAKFIKLDDVAISIDVTLLSNIRYENSLSLYWRALGQNASYIKVEKYDSNAGWFQVYENDSISSNETINNIWIQPEPSGAGTEKRFRVTIKSQKYSVWCALSQIAITGLAGGIEGTLVNRGGSTMYGNLSPYKTGAVSLGNDSARWNEVHANKFYGDGSNLTNLPIDGLPAVTTADNGKVLCVVDGKWAAVTLPST